MPTLDLDPNVVQQLEQLAARRNVSVDDLANTLLTQALEAENAIITAAHLLNMVDQAVIATDMNNKIVFWNRFAEELYGWPADEVIDTDITSLILPESRNAGLEILESLQRGERWTGEFTVKHRSGWVFPIRATNSPIFDPEGNWVGVVGISYDISEQRQAEEALRQSEELYRLLAENATDMIGLHHPEGDFIYASPSMSKVLGYTPEELFELPPANLVHPDDLERAQQEAHPMVMSGQVINGFTYRMLKKSGEPLWVETTSTPIFDADGNVIQLLAISRDITERIRVEEALRYSEALLLAATSSFPRGAIFIFDKDLRYIMVRGQGISEAGVDPQVFEGRTLYEIWPEKVVAEIVNLYRAALVGEHQSQESSFEDRVYWVSNASIEMDGEIVAGMAISFDITERKLAEQNAFELELEREKVRILQNFLEDASHDLNSPVANMNTSLYLLSQLCTTDEQRKRVDTLQSHLKRLNTMLSNLFDMAELDLQDSLRVAPLDLNRLVDELARSYASIAENQSLLLTWVPPRKPLSVQAHEIHLSRALANIIGNAIAYTQAGGTITVATQQNQTWAIVEVSDTGIGISQEHQQRIFDRFFRVDGARNTHEGHNGLGLAIAKKIIDLHDGQIDVWSQVGVGTRFTIQLPLIAR